jgi:hypothetical protein
MQEKDNLPQVVIDSIDQLETLRLYVMNKKTCKHYNSKLKAIILLLYKMGKKINT